MSQCDDTIHVKISSLLSSLWCSIWHQAGFSQKKIKVELRQKHVRHDTIKPGGGTMFPGHCLQGNTVETDQQKLLMEEVKKVKKENKDTEVKPEWTDGDAPVLCQSLFPCWSVSPLSTDTRDASEPASAYRTCRLVSTTADSLRVHRPEIRVSASDWDCNSSAQLAVATMLTLFTTVKHEEEKWRWGCVLLVSFLCELPVCVLQLWQWSFSSGCVLK